MEDYFSGFIGQSNLINELKNLYRYDISLLLRGNSGFGKTTLAKLYASNRGSYDYQLASELDDEFNYNPDAKSHIIDEVHELKRPEILYPYLDSGLVFILCTNESSNLKEALRNRCVERFLNEYSLLDLIKIIHNKYPEFSNGVLLTLAERSRGIPRVALQLALLCKINTNLSLEQVEKYLEESGVYEEGFSRLDLKYLDFLKQVKTASLNTIKSNLGVQESLIKDEIEPYLIKKGKIRITNRREFIE